MVAPKGPFVDSGVDVGHLVEAQRRFVQTANRLPALFDLDDQMYAILALIEDAESVGEEPTDALETQLALVQTALAQKLENYCSVIRSLEHIADARKAEADRLAQRARTAQRAADWLRQRLLLHLQSTGRDRVEMPRFSVSLRANPPRVEVLEEMLVPAEFKKTVVTTTIDKKKILEQVKATGEVPDGIEIVRGQRVQLS